MKETKNSSKSTSTKTETDKNELQITVDTGGLMKMLQCGMRTATNIGESANAKIVIGRRVLWNVRKIQCFIDSISE